MINAVTLIVAVDEPSPDKIGDRAADIGPPRMQKTLANLVRNTLLGSGGIRRQHALVLEVAADLIDNRPAADIALRHWNQGVTEPIPLQDRRQIERLIIGRRGYRSCLLAPQRLLIRK